VIPAGVGSSKTEVLNHMFSTAQAIWPVTVRSARTNHEREEMGEGAEAERAASVVTV